MADGLRLDFRGIGEILKTNCRPLVNQVVDQIAGNIEGESVRQYQTDRAAGAVSVPAHQQARDGDLTRAAAAAGLRIVSR